MRSGILLLASLIVSSPTTGQVRATTPAFPIEESDITITRRAQPNTPFDKVGRKFAILGYESGSFEAWAYPLKLLRDFRFSFLIGSSTEPIEARDIVRTVSASPAATWITYAFQSFTVKAIYITPIDEPGGYVLLDVRTTEPLTILCSFIPVLQPMWPAGIGGQSASWRDDVKAYRISEPTRQNNAFIGSPAAEGISYTPAHMLSDRPSEFRIIIDDPSEVRGRYIPIVMAGGRGNRDSLQALYLRLTGEARKNYLKAVAHYNDLRGRTLHIRTPVTDIDLAFEWAKVSYDNLFVDNPDLGLGMVAGLGASGTGGRPGFGWFFGGDAFINSFSLNSLGATGLTRNALRFTQQWQRNDGKMAHELTQAAAYVDWWNDYPYGYIHGDTSPYYICAVWDYFRHTADTAFVRSSWKTLSRAYAWSRATDIDEDGLMDNAKAGLGALEYGPLTDIQSDIYTGAIWSRAVAVMPALANIAGDRVTARETAAYAGKTRGAFDALFWDEERHRYAYAFTSDGRYVNIVSPWAAVGLQWGLGTEERSRKTLSELSTAELSTDWGIRSISDKSSYYEPLNYNYGAVWPFLSGWVAAAQFRYQRSIQGYNILLASARHSFDNAIGHVTEVFSGDANIWPGEAVPHQGFSSASIVLPLVRGLLGFEVNVPERSVAFAPQFPADWKEVEVRGPSNTPGAITLRYVRKRRSVILEVHAQKDLNVNFSFTPAFGIGTHIGSVMIDGVPAEHKEITSRQTIRPVITSPLHAGTTTIQIAIEPAPELLPPPLEAKTGDRNSGLKVVDIFREEDALTARVEGRAGRTYRMGIVNADLIASCIGCELDQDGRLVIDFPAGAKDDYVQKDIVIHCRRPND